MNALASLKEGLRVSPRDGTIIFFIGKLDVLRVTCEAAPAPTVLLAVGRILHGYAWAGVRLVTAGAAVSA
jgi:hypothetical protein